MAAKNSASEKALRDIIIQRMIQSPRAQPLKTGSDTASLAGNNGMIWEIFTDFSLFICSFFIHIFCNAIFR